MAADSVAVVMPKRITDRTTKVSTPSGTTDAISSLRISSCRAHSGEQVDGDAHRAELQPLEVVGPGDRLLVPAERLRGHRAVGEGDDVGADRAVDLLQQFLAAAVLVPGEQHVRVHAEGGAR